jgi:hypothetical protein
MAGGDPMQARGDGQLPLPHLVRTTAAVIVGHAQLARRRLRRGDDPARVDGHLTAIEAAMRALIELVERDDRRPPDERSIE